MIVAAEDAKMIKITLETGYDHDYEKVTSHGTHKGRVTCDEVELTEEQAQKLLQGFLNRLDQGSAKHFINKYKK